MGLDFLDKTAKPFHRSCQRGFEHLTAASLFDPATSPTRRSIVIRFADQVPDARPGQELVLRPERDGVTAYHCERVVAHCEKPPAEVLGKIREGGLAVGLLQTVYPLSRSADVLVV